MEPFMEQIFQGFGVRICFDLEIGLFAIKCLNDHWIQKSSDYDSLYDSLKHFRKLGFECKLCKKEYAFDIALFEANKNSGGSERCNECFGIRLPLDKCCEIKIV